MLDRRLIVTEHNRQYEVATDKRGRGTITYLNEPTGTSHRLEKIIRLHEGARAEFITRIRGARTRITTGIITNIIHAPGGRP